MKIRMLLSAFVFALVSCGDDQKKEKIVVRIDEEKLASDIVKSLVKSSSRFAELATATDSNGLFSLPEVTEHITTDTDLPGKVVSVSLDEEKLQDAIFRGMVEATQINVKSIKIDSAIEPPVSSNSKEGAHKESVILEISTENHLYGEVAGKRVLLSPDLSQDNLEATKAWLRDTASGDSEKWELRLITTPRTEHGLIRKLVKLAEEEGINEVSFGSAKK